MKITDGILQAVKQEFQKQFPHAEVRILTPAKGSYDDNSKSGIAVYLDAKQDTGARTDNPFYGSEDCFLYSLDGLYGSWKRNLAHRFLDNPALAGLVVSLDTLTIINERSRNWLTRFYSLDGTIDGRPVITVDVWTEERARTAGACPDARIDAICYRAFGFLGTYSWLTDTDTRHSTVTAYIDSTTGAKPASDFIREAENRRFTVIRYGLTQAAGGPMTFTAEIAEAKSDEAISFETPF